MAQTSRRNARSRRGLGADDRGPAALGCDSTPRGGRPINSSPQRLLEADVIVVEIFRYGLCFTSSDRARLCKRSFIASGIPCLVPNALRKTIVHAGGEMKGREDLCIPVTVAYNQREIFRHSVGCSESFPLDYSSFSGSLYTKSDLTQIKNTLIKIEKDLCAMVPADDR